MGNQTSIDHEKEMVRLHSEISRLTEELASTRAAFKSFTNTEAMKIADLITENEKLNQSLLRAIDERNELISENNRLTTENSTMDEKCKEAVKDLIENAEATGSNRLVEGYLKRSSAQAIQIEILTAENERLRRERDELLRACKLGLDHLQEAQDGWYKDKPTCEFMRIAIASTQGEKK